jgi:hypothetical protein
MTGGWKGTGNIFVPTEETRNDKGRNATIPNFWFFWVHVRLLVHLGDEILAARKVLYIIPVEVVGDMVLFFSVHVL